MTLKGDLYAALLRSAAGDICNLRTNLQFTTILLEKRLEAEGTDQEFARRLYRCAMEARALDRSNRA